MKCVLEGPIGFFFFFKGHLPPESTAPTKKKKNSNWKKIYREKQKKHERKHEWNKMRKAALGKEVAALHSEEEVMWFPFPKRERMAV